MSIIFQEKGAPNLQMRPPAQFCDNKRQEKKSLEVS